MSVLFSAYVLFKLSSAVGLPSRVLGLCGSISFRKGGSAVRPCGLVAHQTHSSWRIQTTACKGIKCFLFAQTWLILALSLSRIKFGVGQESSCTYRKRGLVWSACMTTAIGKSIGKPLFRKIHSEFASCPSHGSAK